MKDLRVLWAAVLLCGCSFEAKCNSGESYINTTKGEEVIAEWLGRKGLPAESVTCPKNVPIAPNTSFECEAVIQGAPGVPVSVQVTQKNEEGDVSYGLAPGKPVLVTDTVERQLVGQIKDRNQVEVKADCGQRVYKSEPRATFVCKITPPSGETSELQIEITDALGGWRSASP